MTQAGLNRYAPNRRPASLAPRRPTPARVRRLRRAIEALMLVGMGAVAALAFMVR